MDPFEKRPFFPPAEVPARPVLPSGESGEALARVGTQGGPVALSEAVREVVRGLRAPSTKRAYRADWARWEDWALARGLSPIPARWEDLAEYAVALAATHTVASVKRALSAISTAHHIQGFESPTVAPQFREVLRGLARAKGVRPQRKVPVLEEELCAVVSALELEPNRLKKARDRAMVLLAFAGAFRRSELCALRYEDLLFRASEMHVLLRKSKTDQSGEGRMVAVFPHPTSEQLCPVRSVLRWIQVSGIRAGYLFRGFTLGGKLLDTGKPLSPAVLARIVKDALEAKGVDPKKYGAHSLRAGHVTQAMRHGANVAEVMSVTGHKSADMVLRYRREYDPSHGSSASKLWGPKR